MFETIFLLVCGDLQTFVKLFFCLLSPLCIHHQTGKDGEAWTGKTKILKATDFYCFFSG